MGYWRFSKTCEELARLPDNAIAESLSLAGAYLRSLSFDNARGLLRIPKAEDQLQINGQGGPSIKVLEIALSLWPCAGRSL
jgi:hypothetical protein